MSNLINLGAVVYRFSAHAEYRLVEMPEADVACGIT